MRSAAAAETDHSAWTPVPAARTAQVEAAQDGAEPEPEPHSATACWQFPPLPVHARMARIWLEAWIADRGPGEEAAYRAAVAFSELVTNAVLHGRGPVTVRVRVEPGLVDCEVTDAACDLPVVYEAGDEDEHHRGLSLVDALTTSWQVRPRAGGGKSVAFTVEG
jgi:anti-sigma regulatory factor (Ser/Thr protein kinase)